MSILKTEKEKLSNEDILNYISDYDSKTVPFLNKLWAYYKGENTKIIDKPKPDANSPDNRLIIAYGRKLVTTWTGYGWRPRYITYKATKETDQSIENSDNLELTDEQNKETLTQDEIYVKELQETFNLNNEHIKTSRAGRNIGIFGVSYEIVYIDKVFNLLDSTQKAEPKFFTVDPREMILLYDYDSEPKKKMAIRYYEIDKNWYKVEVYYKDVIEIYDRKREEQSNKWLLTIDSTYLNFFKDIPVVAYYAGDDMLGVIKPVMSLIDANDALYSDSMNEFDKFAFAYMILKGYRLTNPVDMKTPGKSSETLANIKKKRIFEDVPRDAEIKFLLKDIPKDFIEFMSKNLREQIHIQSHVPDFNYMATGSLSGAAIERLMFDFENLVSSSDADFDVGLLERIRLITIIYKLEGRPIGNNDMITISHKRNIPFNLLEMARTAVQMKTAGFSSYLIADIMPDDIIPNIQVELARQRKENEEMIGNDLEGLGSDGLEEKPIEEINNDNQNL
jgi:SPP1 family phage portal protein